MRGYRREVRDENKEALRKKTAARQVRSRGGGRSYGGGGRIGQQSRTSTSTSSSSGAERPDLLGSRLSSYIRTTMEGEWMFFHSPIRLFLRWYVHPMFLHGGGAVARGRAFWAARLRREEQPAVVASAEGHDRDFRAWSSAESTSLVELFSGRLSAFASWEDFNGRGFEDFSRSLEKDPTIEGSGLSGQDRDELVAKQAALLTTVIDDLRTEQIGVLRILQVLVDRSSPFAVLIQLTNELESFFQKAFVGGMDLRYDQRSIAKHGVGG